jgi:RNA polymerase sigma-70 factor, ECF subfamily
MSTSLLAQVQAQEPEAWERLVDLYGPVVYGWCREFGLQPADAADAAQEVFVAVAAAVSNFRRDRPGDSFRGWLWTIARNKVRDHFRRGHTEAVARGGTDAHQRMLDIPQAASDLSEECPGVPNVPGLEQRALDLIRAGVEDRTWQAFWRLAVDGQTAAAVAAELGMSVPAVYKAKYRVMRQLRLVLDGLVE